MPVSQSLLTLSTAIDDRLLERQARTALRGRCERAVRGLAVRVDEAVATVTGQTDSFYAKQLMLHALKHVPGLNGIVDEVVVSPS
jgi:hypothetical protein